MHPQFASFSERQRKIVLEECEASIFWVHEHITPEEIFSDARRQAVFRVRSAIFMRLRNEPAIPGGTVPSLPLIGRMFGKDHTTVISALKKFPKHFAEWSQGKQRLYEAKRLAHCADPNVLAVAPGMAKLDVAA